MEEENFVTYELDLSIPPTKRKAQSPLFEDKLNRNSKVRRIKGPIDPVAPRMSYQNTRYDYSHHNYEVGDGFNQIPAREPRNRNFRHDQIPAREMYGNGINRNFNGRGGRGGARYQTGSHDQGFPQRRPSNSRGNSYTHSIQAQASNARGTFNGVRGHASSVRGPANNRMNSIRGELRSTSNSPTANVPNAPIATNRRRQQSSHPRQTIQVRDTNSQEIAQMLEMAIDGNIANLSTHENTDVPMDDGVIREFLSDADVLQRYGIWLYSMTYPLAAFNEQQLCELQFCLSNSILQYNGGNNLEEELKVRHENFAMFKIIGGAILIVVTRDTEKNFLKSISKETFSLFKKDSQTIVSFHDEISGTAVANAFTITMLNNNEHLNYWKTLINGCSEFPFTFDSNTWSVFTQESRQLNVKGQTYIAFETVGPPIAMAEFNKTHEKHTIRAKRRVLRDIESDIAMQQMIHSSIDLSSISRSNYNKIAKLLNKTVSRFRQPRSDPRLILPGLMNLRAIISTQHCA